MAGLTDFISRIFSTDQTQGLSGGAEVVIDRDPASAFYASRLRKHRTDEDLVETPTWLWATVSFQGRKGGLRAHIQAERGDGVASFTDVLVVLNQADARRAAQVEGEPWTERAARAISEKFALYCQKERFELLYGTRPLRFWFVADGGQDMLGHSFGLGPGEFITGLLPNLYVGPAPRSRAVLAVHLNLPGAWEGYREVGRLYSDQILYTLGRHWLDNFRHPALKEPGLYRLQQFPDGSLVHVISPELQDRYYVRSDALEGGASVLTLAERNGTPIAYLVLAVVETPAAVDPGMTMSMPLAAQGKALGPTTVEVKVDDEVEPTVEAPKRDLLQRTIIPDAVGGRILTLHERGALLQKVHFGNFMDGYDVYIGAGGRIATQMPEPKATLQVRGNRVQLLVQANDVRVNGMLAGVGQSLPLDGIMALEVDGHPLEYRDLTGVRAEGWPYLGELRRPGAGTYLDFGGAYRVGRDRRCQVRLPDEPHNENIAWLPSVGGGTTIRSRNGDIPKSRFYTDSIMVASEHAELDLTGEPVLRSLARHCCTFVRRDGVVCGLAPRETVEGAHEMELRPNDEVLVGNCLFQVSYPPRPGTVDAYAAPPAPAIPRPISAQELAAAMDPPRSRRALGEDDRTEADDQEATLTGKAAPSKPSTRTYDPAVAAGLGERGPAPRPPRFEADSPPGMRPPRPVPPTPEAPAALALAGSSGAPAEAPWVDPPLANVAMASASAIAFGGGAPPPDAPRHASAPPDPTASAGRPRLRSAASLPDLSEAPPPPASIPPNEWPKPAPPKAGPTAPPGGRPPPPMLLEDPVPPPDFDSPLFEEAESLDPNDPVLSVEEARWKMELSRPARLVQVGWMVSGETVIGNHVGAGLIVPEVRAFREQAFLTLDYFRLSTRGKKAKIELLQEGDAQLTVNGAEVEQTDDLDRAVLTIVRRDENLEPDFDVTLRVLADNSLPDPRARLVTVDTTDRLVAALFTLGFPLRADRRLRIGKLSAVFRYDGSRLRVSDYLQSYRVPGGGFQSFFVREGDRGWQTFPEDGSPLSLGAGDGLIIGNAVYRFTT